MKQTYRDLPVSHVTKAVHEVTHLYGYLLQLSEAPKGEWFDVPNVVVVEVEFFQVSPADEHLSDKGGEGITREGEVFHCPRQIVGYLAHVTAVAYHLLA